MKKIRLVRHLIQEVDMYDYYFLTSVNTLYAINAIVISYLLGSLPTSYLIGNLWGKDPTKVGSGNVGAANTFRHISRRAGLFSMILDMGKGFLAVCIAAAVSPEGILPLLAALTVVAGHNWMIFLRFKGGKGLAASAGALLALSPLGLPVIILAIILVLLFIRDTNTAAAIGTIALPFYLFFVYSWAGFLLGLLWALLILLKSRPDFAAYKAGRRRLI
jgi:acyl phosphate:glycerol-3-phosphate acyltransferase